MNAFVCLAISLSHDTVQQWPEFARRNSCRDLCSLERGDQPDGEIYCGKAYKGGYDRLNTFSAETGAGN